MASIEAIGPTDKGIDIDIYIMEASIFLGQTLLNSNINLMNAKSVEE